MFKVKSLRISWLLLLVSFGFMGCSSTAPSGDASGARQDEPVKTVSVRIDTMTCVEGCFNGVKRVLKKREGIEDVVLAPQKKEGEIDNSVVLVSYRGTLNKSEIERTVLGAGFDSIEFLDADSGTK
ncbi:MAG: heavy-metal-associated domain-containing protein [Planctomycetes bacterium]|nr:heavy-metal-associated domain-containing protein [Planctomycetota bacterium]